MSKMHNPLIQLYGVNPSNLTVKDVAILLEEALDRGDCIRRNGPGTADRALCLVGANQVVGMVQDTINLANTIPMEPGERPSGGTQQRANLKLRTLNEAAFSHPERGANALFGIPPATFYTYALPNGQEELPNATGILAVAFSSRDGFQVLLDHMKSGPSADVTLQNVAAQIEAGRHATWSAPHL